MSLLQRLNTLPEDSRQRIYAYYQNISAPSNIDLIEVRRVLSNWIEKNTLYNGVNTNPEEHRDKIEYWRETFLALLQLEIEINRNNPDFVAVRLSNALAFIGNLEPAGLFSTVKGCVNMELEVYFQFLSDSIDSLNELLTVGENQKSEFFARLARLRSTENEHADRLQNLAVAEQNGNFVAMQQLQVAADFSNVMVQEWMALFSQAQNQLSLHITSFIEKIQGLVDALVADSEQLFPPNDFQDTGTQVLNLDELSSRYDNFVHKVLALGDSIHRIDQFLRSIIENATQPFDFVIQQQTRLQGLANNVETIFRKLKTRSLIIEKQLGNIIKQDTIYKVLNVRFVAPNSLQLNFSRVKPKLAIISDRQAEMLLNGIVNVSALTECGEIKYKKMEFSRASATYKFLDVKILKRPNDPENPQKPSVLKYKFHLLFYAETDFRGNPYTIWTLSCPFVYISNVSQIPEASLTIFWDLHLKEGNSHEGPEQVTVGRLLQAFNTYIQRETSSEGWNLTESQGRYLAGKLLQGEVGPGTIVTRRHFEMARNPAANVSFWNWFFASVLLIKKHLIPMWRQGTIFGFSSRDMAESQIEASPVGTFLLRLSDTVEGGVSITWRPNVGPSRSVHPLSDNCLNEKNITDRIHNIQYFRNVLCPVNNRTVDKSIAFPANPPPATSPDLTNRPPGHRPYIKSFMLWSILFNWS